jgi:hypothetical protein
MIMNLNRNLNLKLSLNLHWKRRPNDDLNQKRNRNQDRHMPVLKLPGQLAEISAFSTADLIDEAVFKNLSLSALTFLTELAERLETTDKVGVRKQLLASIWATGPGDFIKKTDRKECGRSCEWMKLGVPWQLWPKESSEFSLQRARWKESSRYRETCWGRRYVDSVKK